MSDLDLAARTALPTPPTTGDYLLVVRPSLADVFALSPATLAQSLAQSLTQGLAQAADLAATNQALATTNAALASVTATAGTVTGKLSRAANLSDLVDVPTSRANLGLARIAVTGAYADLADAPAAYSLPAASTNTLGGVKVDGTTVTITNGVISATGGAPPAAYSLPTASTNTLGGVKVDGTTVTITNGVISATGGAPPAAYSLPTASTKTLGGVKVDGTTVTITNGVISATAAAGSGGATNTYTTSGAIAPTDAVAIIDGGAVMTLADGGSVDHSILIKLKSNTVSATLTGNIEWYPNNSFALTASAPAAGTFKDSLKLRWVVAANTYIAE